MNALVSSVVALGMMLAYESAKNHFVLEIEMSGGVVSYASQYDADGLRIKNNYRLPLAWRQIFGNAFLETPVTVSIGPTVQVVRKLDRLSMLSMLNTLSIAQDKLSQDDFQAIGDLKRLRNVELLGVEVSDSDLQHFRALPALRFLRITTAKSLTGSGLSRMTSDQLEGLILTGCGITDIGLRGISSCTALRQLDLSDTDLTGSGLSQLSGLTNLEFLDLSDTNIRDSTLKGFRHPRRLQSLVVDGTKVSALGIEWLKKETTIMYVNFSNTPAEKELRERSITFDRCAGK